jgi:hypothetical protein
LFLGFPIFARKRDGPSIGTASHTEIGWPPGLHRALLKQHGAKGSSLPVVLDGDLVIEGSGAIIDWAESKAQDQTRSLNPQTGD